MTDLKLYCLKHPRAPYNVLGPTFQNCTQTLTPLKREGPKFRDIYGRLITVGGGSVYYSSTISGQGPVAPSAESLVVGEKFCVHCIYPMNTAYVRGPQVVPLTRPCVSGSVFLVEEGQSSPLPLETKAESLEVSLPSGSEGYLSYCPILYMALTHFETKWSESQLGILSWTLSFEEIEM